MRRAHPGFLRSVSQGKATKVTCVDLPDLLCLLVADNRDAVFDAVAVPQIDSLVSWAEDIKSYTLEQALSGVRYPGFKLVEGRSNRKYTDEVAVAQVVSNAGYDPYEKKLLGITAMTKKVKLVHDENADYDSRLGNNTNRVEQLQSTQTRNVGAVIKWCSEHWIWFAIAGTIGIGAATPPGRKLIASAAGKIKALPT